MAPTAWDCQRPASDESMTGTRQVEILVVYYSRHGSTARLARQICRGVESVAGPTGPPEDQEGVIDIMALLKQSVEATERARETEGGDESADGGSRKPGKPKGKPPAGRRSQRRSA